ncbi:beta-ribofuranosylaminobenzene 5'-phosphate synthase family protein [Saccharothrix sp. Mg75]|uniref:beta-ribofuranosylaminobenzene 5'-phosphate synthase family protein n=1 Tax=Saccharothrix sp. Mg75 TaxID=3445357 RepID=UPI003EEE45D4
MDEVVVRAYPRVHFGLVDLGGATARAYGGAGAAFAARPSCTRARLADRFEAGTGFSGDSRDKIIATMRRAEQRGLDVRAAVTLSDPLPAHTGYGAGTAMVLSVLTAVARLREWPIGDAELIHLSGRGRTSGVGCSTFFRGGFVVDAGQAVHPADGVYRPSSDPRGRPPSTVIGSWPLPETWRITMLIPVHDRPQQIGSEDDFFRDSTPVASHDVLTQLAHLYHGMLPAVIDADLEAFATSLREFQRRGFKAAEIGARPPAVRHLLDAAWDAGVAAGLSSMGPAVFLVHDRRGPTGLVSLDTTAWRVAGPYPFRNDGAACEVRPG